MRQEVQDVRTRIENNVIEIPWSGCWVWLGGLTNKGYASIIYKGKRKEVQRLAYEEYIGKVPEGLELDHLCRVRCCVNPGHLEPVTHKENCRRGECGINTGKRQRAKTHCPRGHPYDGENTYIGSRGERVCRECKRLHAQRYRAARAR